MAEKLFYSMGEVAETFDVSLSLIRYWESQFDILKPKKNKKGNRMFRPEDMENFKMIYHLVKECGMTLDGARRAMRKRGKNSVARSAELMERLENVRSMLLEMRTMLGEEDSGSIVIDDEANSEPQDMSDGVTVIEPGRLQRLEEEKRAEEEKQAAERKANLPFYEQTLF